VTIAGIEQVRQLRQLSRAELAIDPLDAARSLLGCILLADGVPPAEDAERGGAGGTVSAGDPVAIRVVEVEAYRGTDDSASHCYPGRTSRNAVMFGPAGHLYVYFVYGMHHCANVVSLTDGVPGAVLLRGGEVISGLDAARRRRPAARGDAELAKGPARLTSVLGIGPAVNGIDLVDPGSPVRLLAGEPVADEVVRTGPRVGVATAMDVPWRFWIDGSKSVSAYQRGGRRRSVAGR
jgi:DNA-3-methyladenine glycosylase